MERKEIESAVEAILFASGEPVQEKRICMALDLARPAVERALHDLRDLYAYERRGIRLVQMEDSWQLCSAPEHAGAIRRALEIRKPATLSRYPGVCGPDPGSGPQLHRRASSEPEAD